MTHCIFCLLLLIIGCAADWNAERFRYPACVPAACAEEGSCYCSNRKEGWYDGGAGYGRDSRSTKSDPLCYKAGKGDCECMDCGQVFIFPNVQCQDLRCHDETDIGDVGEKCYRMDPEKGKVYTEPKWYFDCYRTRNLCDDSKCLHGEKLTGCMRVSSGKCQSCGNLEAGMYWTTRGGCGKAACDNVQPGYYMTAPCSITANTVKLHCSEHMGNPKARAFANPVPQYYCPGGAAAPVKVPAFGKVNSDYTDFNCEPGYSKHADECRACLPGSACMYDKSFTCKADYYTERYAQSSCKRCTAACTYPNELPMRCQEGSIQNSRCVTCGVCGVYPATGVNCVRDLVAFQELPEVCSPKDVVNSDVIVCNT